MPVENKIITSFTNCYVASCEVRCHGSDFRSDCIDAMDGDTFAYAYAYAYSWD